ncbi:MAG: response regulator, partial [Rhodobacteraceae bacterium]|nr:response regulator [Paracoccaceae bacterium]
MKTSYNILWIDDEPNNTQPDQIDITEFLEEFGIYADIKLVEAPPDGSIHDRIKDNLSNPELDILIVDYHMNGLSGDELVHLIRNTDHVYLPVIFYSSSPEEEIFDAVCTKRLDGVYIANRRFLMDKFKDVVRSLLNKEQTTKQTRGLL